MKQIGWMKHINGWETDRTEETGRRDGTDGAEMLKDGIDGICWKGDEEMMMSDLKAISPCSQPAER